MTDDDILAAQISTLNHLAASRGHEWIIGQLQKMGYDIVLAQRCQSCNRVVGCGVCECEP